VTIQESLDTLTRGSPMGLKLEHKSRDLNEPDKVLVTKNLSIAYDGHQIVDGISFSIKAGEVYGLVGSSGSGKSSIGFGILNYLPSNAKVSADELRVCGTDIRCLDSNALQVFRGRRIACVYQNPGASLNPTLTIGAQVSLVLRIRKGLSRKQSWEAATYLLSRVKIRLPGRVMALYPHQISGGMQQRVSIAIALSQDPDLVVLDEPTTALDLQVKEEILTLLEDVRRNTGTSFFLISHDRDFVLRLADRVGVLSNGRLVEYAKGTLPTENIVDLKGLVRTSTASSRKALEVNNLTHRFGRQCILENVTFSVASGGSFGLIGESGSGKTTLAKIVSGLERRCEGNIRLFGAHLPASLESRSLNQKRSLQLVFQSPDQTLNPAQSVGTIMHSALAITGLKKTEIDRQVMDRLDEVGLPRAVLNKLPRELSGGQRQRVAIARAYASEPKLIILDEPTSALDADNQLRIITLLKEMQSRRGTSFLLISHDLDVVTALADEVGVLYRGKLVEIGSTSEVFGRPSHDYTKLLLAPYRTRASVTCGAAPC